MLDALAVHRTLLEHDVPHEVVRLPRPIQTADELPEVLDVPADVCAVVRCYVAPCKSVPADGGCSPVLHAVIVPAGVQPSIAALRTALRAASLRDATPAEINKVTDCSARLVTAVGLPVDVPVIIDNALDMAGTVWMSTGDSGTALALPSPALLAVTGATVHRLTGSEDVVIDLTALATAPVPPQGPGATVAAASGARPGGVKRPFGA